MSDELIAEKLVALQGFGLTSEQAVSLLGGAMYYEQMGGTKLASYWPTEGKFNIRDEYYIISNSIFALASLCQKVDTTEWLLSFQVAYIFQIKTNAHSILSIDHLVSQYCYADALAVARALHSRVNLLLICSLSPGLFNDWLKNPKDPRFLDGHIRQELEAHGINTMEHLYEFGSEIIHGHYKGHTDIGYFEQGLFNEIRGISDRIFILAKFLLGICAYSMVQATLLGSKGKTGIEPVEQMNDMYEKLFESALHPSRCDHLQVMIAEDRHWKKVGKDTYDLGGCFSFTQYKDQLQKFHRSTGQRKKLSKRYNISAGDG